MWRSDRGPSLWAIGAVVLLVVTAGCASVDAPRTSPEPSQVNDDRDAPRLALEGDYGFTVTEVVRIGSDVRRDYQQATALLAADQLDAGIRLLESVVERAPDVTIPHIDLGLAYARLAAYDKAETSLRAALALAPNHPAALNELGILYRRTGRFDAARSSYEQAIAIHPGFHFALLNLGMLCDLYLEDLNCALEHYERYAEIVTDDDQVDIWIADVRARLGTGQEQ